MTRNLRYVIGDPGGRGGDVGHVAAASVIGQRPRQRHICGQVASWHRGITTVAVWHRRCRAAADLAQASCEHTPGRGGCSAGYSGRDSWQALAA